MLEYQCHGSYSVGLKRQPKKTSPGFMCMYGRRSISMNISDCFNILSKLLSNNMELCLFMLFCALKTFVQFELHLHRVMCVQYSLWPVDLSFIGPNWNFVDF